jgi:hypothetical protein
MQEQLWRSKKWPQGEHYELHEVYWHIHTTIPADSYLRRTRNLSTDTSWDNSSGTTPDGHTQHPLPESEAL